MTDEDSTAEEGGHLSRRQILGGAGAAGVGLVLGGAAGYTAVRATDGVDSGQQIVPFHGAHQAGILTPQQSRMVFAAFDVTTSSIEELMRLLGRWSAAAALMAEGKPVGPTASAPQSPPWDTGEAVGIGPEALTITVGFGTTLFDKRFGLAEKRPKAFADLPPIPGDADLVAEISGGDLCVQACANDPQVAFHVIRNFARIARGDAVLRWSQIGFGRASSTSKAQQTPRNLMGFKDGTNNLKAEDPSTGKDFVWVGPEGEQQWMRGGSYLVTRKIRMLIENWDSDRFGDQQDVIGRTKGEGAPLGHHREFDHIDLAKLPPDSHVRLAHSMARRGVSILRRGYNYADGIDPDTGQLDAGLFFIAYQKDPHKQFVPIQTSLGSNDALNEYIKHVSSSLFAVPPGLQHVGDWYGKTLFT